jgi:hypothetical protein
MHVCNVHGKENMQMMAGESGQIACVRAGGCSGFWPELVHAESDQSTC